MLRRALVLVVVALQVAVFGSLIAARVVDWSRSGWAGLAYQLDTEANGPAQSPAFFWAAGSRAVEMLVPGGPAARAGVEEGDLVVSVNGIPVAEVRRLQALADELGVGDRVAYRVERDGNVVSLSVPLENPYRRPIIVAATATSVIAGAAFLLISMLVYWSRSRSRVAPVFFWMCVFGAAEYLIWAAIELDMPSLRGVAPAVIEPVMFLGLGLVGLLSVALVDTLLHLVLVFPRPRPAVERNPRIVVWLHTLPFLLPGVLITAIASAVAAKTVAGLAVLAPLVAAGSAAAALRLRRLATDSGLREAVIRHPLLVEGLVLCAGAALGPVLRLVPDPAAQAVVVGLFVAAFGVGMLAIVAYSVLIIVSLVRSYRESGTDEKQQLRWPLWGTLTAVGGTIVLMAASLILSLVIGGFGHVDFTVNAGLTAASKLVYLLIPVSLAFGIVKYRLMDIDLIIKKTVIYSGVTGFVLVVYLALAGASGLALARSAGVESQIATVVATLVVVALFVPVRNRIQRLVDRFFFRREQDSAAAVRRVAELTSGAPSLDAMALGVAEEVQRALRCRTVAVLTQSPGRELLEVAATVGLPDRAGPGLSLPAVSPVLHRTSPLVRFPADAATDEEHRLADRASAVLGAVGRRGAEPVGLILVGAKLSREPSDDGDEVFLEAVAGQLAVGLGRLRGRRVELELAQALEIQRSLLPAEIPQIAGLEVRASWQPAREVSGDYYDVLALGGGRLGLCIGDVVGKGMPAALLMSSLQASVRAVATANADPAAVCTQVRSVVTSNLTGGRFVTFFYAVVDGGARRLRFTNCGHNPPVLARADGTVERLAAGGPAFARLMRGEGYSAGEVELRSGDRLVLFTDGVSEAADPAGEQFGEERLVDLVVRQRSTAAAELEAAIEGAVFDHARGALQDDLTLVVAAVE